MVSCGQPGDRLGRPCSMVHRYAFVRDVGDAEFTVLERDRGP